MAGWIGVDLDGTLAYSDGRWRGVHHVGEPIVPMVRRVREWLVAGIEVRIVTARVCDNDSDGARPYIEDWCVKHLGQKLPVTNEKDYDMIELWDDRAVQIIPNTGRRADQHE